MKTTSNNLKKLNKIPVVSTKDHNTWFSVFKKTLYGQIKIEEVARYMVVNNHIVETKEIIVHTFEVGDVEDPDLYAAEPIYKWQQTPAGTWVMKNSLEAPTWSRHSLLNSYYTRYKIVANFTLKKLSEYYLRWT